ncbi:MAG: hypothetical protein BWY75_02046 [bacterium ADurb.Bin425]|nr:MAG: hypothetical protein BWY75_02046 [bacterium ADurb.Bin425]
MAVLAEPAATSIANICGALAFTAPMMSSSPSAKSRASPLDMVPSSTKGMSVLSCSAAPSMHLPIAASDKLFLISSMPRFSTATQLITFSPSSSLNLLISSCMPRFLASSVWFITKSIGLPKSMSCRVRKRSLSKVRAEITFITISALRIIDVAVRSSSLKLDKP